jgi:hypothetical protein
MGGGQVCVCVENARNVRVMVGIDVSEGMVWDKCTAPPWGGERLCVCESPWAVARTLSSFWCRSISSPMVSDILASCTGSLNKPISKAQGRSLRPR